MEWEAAQGPLAEQLLLDPQKEPVGQSRYVGGAQKGLWYGNQALSISLAKARFLYYFLCCLCVSMMPPGGHEGNLRPMSELQQGC